MTSRLTLSALLYPFECIDQAITDYAQLGNLRIVERSTDSTLIEIEPKSDQHKFRSQLTHEFLNYVLDISLDHHLRN